MKATLLRSLAPAFFLYLISGDPLAAPVRNEALASRFMFCANVSQFFYQYLSKNEPHNKGINGFRESKNLFWMAAAAVSDGEYLKAERDRALAKVVEVLELEKKEKKNFMDAEAKSCLETLQNDAIPLFK